MEAPQLTQEQIDAFRFGDLKEYTYLGDNHWYTFYTCECKVPGPHGIMQPHFVPEYNVWCAGGITFTGHEGNVHWTLEQLDPLTLSPSLLCRCPRRLWREDLQGECGDHGFIREGRWVRA